MGTSGEKFPQAWRRQRDGVRPGYAGDLEADLPRGGEEIRFHSGEI